MPRPPDRESGRYSQRLFVYLLRAKTELYNHLYRELKSEMAATAMKGLPASAELRERFFRVWQNWTSWAVTFPEKRQALAELSVSGEITAESRAAGHKILADLAEMADRSRANGPMRRAPLRFVFAVMNSVAEATMDHMLQVQGSTAKKASRRCGGWWSDRVAINRRHSEPELLSSLCWNRLPCANTSNRKSVL